MLRAWITCLAVVLFCLQANGQIIIDARVDLDEGGTAQSIGMVTDDAGVVDGFFAMRFLHSDHVASVQITEIWEVLVGGPTSFFTGRASAILRTGNRFRRISGSCEVLVHDLSSRSDFLDQILIIFTSDDGNQFFGRRGEVTDGNIEVRLP